MDIGVQQSEVNSSQTKRATSQGTLLSSSPFDIQKIIPPSQARHPDPPRAADFHTQRRDSFRWGPYFVSRRGYNSISGTAPPPPPLTTGQPGSIVDAERSELRTGWRQRNV